MFLRTLEAFTFNFLQNIRNLKDNCNTIYSDFHIKPLNPTKQPTAKFCFRQSAPNCFLLNLKHLRQLYQCSDVSICRLPTDLALTVSTILLAMNNRRAISPGRNIPALITRRGGRACDPRGEHVQGEPGPGDNHGR